MKETLSERGRAHNPQNDELTEKYVSARMSGDYTLARHLKSLMSPPAEPVESSLVKARCEFERGSAAWKKKYVVGTISESFAVQNAGSKLRKAEVSDSLAMLRVAPAAEHANESEIVAPWDTPRSGNTGGTYIGTTKADRKAVNDVVAPYQKDAVVVVDYLTVTFNSLGDSSECQNLYSEVSDLMADHDIELRARDKGLYSYKNSALLHVPGCAGDGHNCGFVAWTDDGDSLGLMVELTGAGCEFLRARGEYDGLLEMYSVIVLYSGRISRVDPALDLMHEYCDQHGLTVPVLAKRGREGEFKSDYAPCHAKQSENQQGDWGDMLFNGVTPEKYDPEVHGVGGITSYLGSSKSDNQIVFYEKGKQLLGGISGLSDRQQARFDVLASNPERNKEQQEEFIKLSDKSGYDGQYEDKKKWVRIERRLRRKSSKKIIDPSVLLNPEAAFCDGFRGLRALLDDYCVWVKGRYADIVTFQKNRVDLVKSVSIAKKAHWAKMHAGSFVRTMISEGLSDSEIVDILKREAGLKEYVFDLLDYGFCGDGVVYE